MIDCDRLMENKNFRNNYKQEGVDRRRKERLGCESIFHCVLAF